MSDIITTWLQADSDNNYQQGIEDLADKVIGLIYDSDFELSLPELVEFLEAEKGYRPSDDVPAEFQPLVGRY